MNKKITIIRQLQKYSSTTDALAESGFTSKIVVLEKEIIETNRFLSQKFQLPLGTLLFYIKRIRYVEDTPKTIETSYIPYQYVQGIEKEELENVSFYHLLKEKYKISIVKSEEEILLINANEEEKTILKPLKEKILLLKGKTFDEELKHIEYFENVSIVDFYIFRSVTEL